MKKITNNKKTRQWYRKLSDQRVLVLTRILSTSAIKKRRNKVDALDCTSNKVIVIADKAWISLTAVDDIISYIR